MPSRAPHSTSSSDTMEMALLAISPMGGMKNRQIAAMATPQEKEAMARRDWILVSSSDGSMILVF